MLSRLAEIHVNCVLQFYCLIMCRKVIHRLMQIFFHISQYIGIGFGLGVDFEIFLCPVDGGWGAYANFQNGVGF